ncbi:MAG: hypothetical protein COA53_06380 [Rhodobacteraceae bacterium]|nr:MAG: hypothetical protein COA53_06380 [Paracoccaceae bacterium]
MKYQPFFEVVEKPLYFGTLPGWQSEPLIALVGEAVRRNRSIEHTAYVLATAHHETGRFKFTHELGKGSGRDYGQKLLIMRGQYVRYYGRSYVQLTWLANYARMSIRLSMDLGREIDLVNNPDLAVMPEIASAIIWEGMIGGMFTGKNLADYVNGDRVDYVKARKIVNGNDKAKKIAGYAEQFETALRALNIMKGVAA